MKSQFDTKISYYSNVEDNVGTEISLRDFLFCDKYKEQIEHIRSIKDEEQQKSLKKQLPLATISGTFAPTRKAENLVSHSNLLCVDIDKKDNMSVPWFDNLKHEWHNIPQVLYAAHSVRGEGSLPSSTLPILKNIALISRLYNATLPIVDWWLTNPVRT